MPERGGKAAALNHGIRSTSGEVVVFTDANAMFAADAVRELVRPFADPEVGGVCGNQENRPGRGALARGEVLYWEFDKWLKRQESRTGSIVAADGSIYAIRREHLETIPPGVTDDFFISTAVVRDHRRLVFAERARSMEEPLEREGDHFRRRVRITHQAMRSLAARRELLDPRRYGVYAFVLLGHKVLRRLAAPAILLLLPVSAIAAPKGGIFLLALVAQVVLYAAAAVGILAGDRIRSRALVAPTYFVLGILGTTVGIWRFLRGERSVMWEPVRR
jgi:cellulose synthase/poly-beta-1,6-N-acetylglucosamine synthase-like glycosyltransferase